MDLKTFTLNWYVLNIYSFIQFILKGGGHIIDKYRGGEKMLFVSDFKAGGGKYYTGVCVLFTGFYGHPFRRTKPKQFEINTNN